MQDEDAHTPIRRLRARRERQPASSGPDGTALPAAAAPRDGREQPDEAAAPHPAPVTARPAPGAGPRAARVAAFVAVIAISAAIMIYREQLSALGAYGYPGIFLINLAASATLFLPVPGLALAFAAGSSFVPTLVGLATGAGSAIGELTGYLAGFSGQGVIENQAGYARVHGWMDRYGLGVIFVLSLIPNPLFDAAGIAAGVMRIPVWQFLLACSAGKVIKATVVAYAGAGSADLLQRWLMH